MKLLSVLSGLCFLAVLFMNCGEKSVAAPTGKTPQLLELWIPDNQVSAWIVDVNASFTKKEYTTSAEFWNLLNGGADVFINGGLVKCMREPMVMIRGADTLYLQMDVQQYPNPTKANAIFKSTATSNIRTKTALTGYTDNQAQADLSSGGVQIYANLGQYYFNINLTGYTDNAVSVTDGVAFLDKLKTFF